ncbi:hypothetical protein [Streptomyces sp. JV180]|nr:hypothetical protein [Streptomyces sp. JV180]MBD3545829.1 hypothetical protein [Streptomyces sp. JV180]
MTAIFLRFGGLWGPRARAVCSMNAVSPSFGVVFSADDERLFIVRV